MTLWIGIALALIGALAVLIVFTSGRRSVAVHSPEEALHLRNQLITSGVSPRVAAYVAQGKRLEAVKTYREETGLGLKEATRYIDQLLRETH